MLAGVVTRRHVDVAEPVGTMTAGIAEAKLLAAQPKAIIPTLPGRYSKASTRCSPAPASASLMRCDARDDTTRIGSMIGTVRVVTARVKTWRDGDMKTRWTATGMIEAQRSFRRVRGHNDMAALVSTITNAVNPDTDTPRDYPEVA